MHKPARFRKMGASVLPKQFHQNGQGIGMRSQLELTIRSRS